MKLFTIISVFFFVLCFPFLTVAKTILIASGEFAPYTSATLMHQGFANHVIAEAFKQEGYVAEFKYLPWKRTYLQTQKGKYLAASYYNKAQKHEKDFYFSDPLLTTSIVFFVLKGTGIQGWNQLSDLKPYRIGATHEYTYTKEFWKLGKSGELQIDVANSDTLNLKKLIRRRIDLFPMELVAGYELLRKEFQASTIHTIDVLPKALSTNNGILLFSKKHPESKKWIPIFNRGLKKIRDNGLYAKMEDQLLAGAYSK